MPAQTSQANIPNLLIFSLGCLFSFFVGKEYEQRKLHNTYINERVYDSETNKITIKRIFYR